MREKDLFSIISGKFFKPLTGKRKSLFIGCLIGLYREITNSQNGIYIARSDARYVIGKIMEDYEQPDEDDDETIPDEDEPKELQPGQIMSILMKTGWLAFDYTDNIDVVKLTPPAMEIIRAILKIIYPDNIAIGKYLQTTKLLFDDILKGDHAYGDPYSALLIAKKNADELSQAYVQIDNMVINRIKTLMEMNATSDILSNVYNFGLDYLEGKINHLLSEGANAVNEDGMQKQIEQIRYTRQIRESIKSHLAFDESIGGPSMTDMEKEEAIDSLLDHIKLHMCDNHTSKITGLRINITKYFQTARQHLALATTQSGDTERILRNIMSYMRSEENNEQIDEILSSLCPKPQEGIRNENNLYSPKRAIRADDGIEILPDAEPPKLPDLTKIKKKYTPKTVCRAVRNILNGRKTINSQEVPHATQDEMLMLVNIVLLHSTEPKSCDYTIEMTGKTIHDGHTQYPEFILQTKETTKHEKGAV